MEFSQLANLEFLLYLKEQGFERYENSTFLMSYIKQHKDWYVCVNPCGKPIIALGKEPKNFCIICSCEHISSAMQRLETLDEYLELISKNQ